MNKNRVKAFGDAVDAMENYLFIGKWIRNPENQLYFNTELDNKEYTLLDAFKRQSKIDFGK